MERLTNHKNNCKREMICRYEECDTCEEYCPRMNEDNCTCLQEILEKLAAYEDIGLTPKQLKEIDKLYAEKCKKFAVLTKGVDALISCLVKNMRWCPFEDESGIDFERECVGFMEPGCKECILRNIERLN